MTSSRYEYPDNIFMTQRQLLLDIHPRPSPRLDNFVVGENAELITRLAGLADPDVFDQIYLWGAPGSGRSHLLRGTQAAAQARGRPVSFIEGAQLGEELAPQPGSLIVIDDVDQLNATAQITLFRIFNAARLVGLALLLGGSAPPLQLVQTLREDLRTRIGNALIYEVRTLGDAEKAAALRSHAASRGLRIDDALIDYLLHHGRRDLPSLLTTLDALDRASLEQRRAATLPLLRSILQTDFNPNGMTHESDAV
jgi:DnaA family protein